MLGDSVRRRQRGGRARANRSPGERNWPRTLGLFAAALALPFVVGYLIAVYVLFPPTEVVGTGGTPVPDLVGRTISEAHRDLVGVGLGDMPTTELPHPEVPEGIIVAQSPLPGQQLRSGSPVRVAVSSGRARVNLPDVLGFSAERADALLRRAGFEVQRSYLESPAPEGQVIRTEPQPGSMLALPALVVIVVSSGPPPEAEPGALPDSAAASSR